MGRPPAVGDFDYAASDRLLRVRARTQRAIRRRTGLHAVLRCELRRS
jgi:hypothetical protein